MYAKDLEEPKYQLWINKRELAGQKYLQDKNAFIQYSNSIDDIQGDINDYNEKRKKEKSFNFV